MPLGLGYTCGRCANKLEFIVKSFELIRQPESPREREAYKEWERNYLNWLAQNTRTYICDSCWVSLVVPRTVNAENWEEWKRSSLNGYHPFDKYPFLVSLVGRIDEAVCQKSETVIDLGPLNCPYCSSLLAVKTEFEFAPKCPECGASDMKLTDSGHATMGVIWPPIP